MASERRTNRIFSSSNPAGIYLLKVNNRSTRTRCEICSKSTIKIPERRQWQLPIVVNEQFHFSIYRP